MYVIKHIYWIKVTKGQWCFKSDVRHSWNTIRFSHHNVITSYKQRNTIWSREYVAPMLSRYKTYVFLVFLWFNMWKTYWNFVDFLNICNAFLIEKYYIYAKMLISFLFFSMRRLQSYSVRNNANWISSNDNVLKVDHM